MKPDFSVLYVEDDLKSRHVLRLYLNLQLKFNHVAIFEDSANFMERVVALTPQPDIILLDIHVPPLDGFEMLKLIRGTPHLKDIPVVALTASVMNEEVHALKNAGFNGCLAKPLDLKAFPEDIEQIMNGARVWRII